MIWNLHNFFNTSEIKNISLGIFDVCVSNTKKYKVEKIIANDVYYTDFNCNQQICDSGTGDYNITCNGKTILTTVSFPTQRIILQNGMNKKLNNFYLNEHYI